ncbi:MAG TPA: response regulator [Isosphaeraceae bacterium]|nr:response regulator [Isosphaeraceae bacterium]
MSEPTVYVVDDDPDMRDSLRWLMTSVGLRVEVFESASAFLSAFAPVGPGCLVFDVRMPETSGLDLYEQLAARGEGIPVIFITAYADVAMAVRAMKSGAVEFVEKPFNRQMLLDRVQRAIRDDTERLRRLSDQESVRRRFESLTDKEREVLALVLDGYPNKGIASSLDITPRAVEMRRASLMNKLGARSLAELVRMAVGFDSANADSQTLR